MADQPPLGHLRGMYYDREKKRYFPLNGTKAPASHASPALMALGTAMLYSATGREGCERKRRMELWEVGESPAAGRRIRRSLGRPSDGRVEHRLGRSVLCGVTELCECRGEVITSIKSYGTGAMCMTTDHGKLIWLGADREVHSMSVCSQQLIGMHCDVMRGTWLAVSNGNEPHIHAWRRDHSNPEHPILELPTIEFPHRDIWAISSFDNRTMLASSKSLYLVRLSESGLGLTRRRLSSDPLALHLASSDIVYAGLRSSAVIMEDLRVRTASSPNVVATLPTGRAVIGVKRLKDSAVPWGLAVSGMSHQLMIFDVRFASKPLLDLPGHVNTYHTALALETSPDDTVIFAGGSDRRLRAWLTVTGERILPPASDGRHNALSMTYRYLVQHADVAEDLTLRVAAAGDILRFLPQRDSPRTRFKAD